MSHLSLQRFAKLVALLFAVGACGLVRAQPIRPDDPVGFQPPWGWPDGQFNGYWGFDHDNTKWQSPGTNSSWDYGETGQFTSPDGVWGLGWMNNTSDEKVIKFHLMIENTAQASPAYKDLWFQFDWWTSKPIVNKSHQITGSNDNDWATNEGIAETKISEDSIGLDGGWVRQYEHWKISPQPARERISWSIIVPPGERFLVNDVYFSTRCVPEPIGTMAFGMLLLLGTYGRRMGNR